MDPPHTSYTWKQNICFLLLSNSRFFNQQLFSSHLTHQCDDIGLFIFCNINSVSLLNHLKQRIVRMFDCIFIRSLVGRVLGFTSITVRLPLLDRTGTIVKKPIQSSTRNQVLLGFYCIYVPAIGHVFP